MTTSPDLIPARLHVLLAREAPFGLVIRRGPSKQTAILGWNLKTDEFNLGQWLKGRIIERRCDLSPDGKNWIYFASNYNGYANKPDTWTAVALAPYLKATHFYPKNDSWNGGGLFLDNNTFWLNDGVWSPHKIERETSRPYRVPVHPDVAPYHGEDFGLYFPRLRRDGWNSVEAEEDAEFLWQKTQSGWTLHKWACAGGTREPGRGVYFDRHELRDAKTGEVFEGHDWEWADFSGKRVVWARAGQLFSMRIWEGGHGKVEMLHDFNAMQFEPLIAPY